VADLFNCVESWSTFHDVKIGKAQEPSPRFITAISSHWSEREESEVSVRHVVVLGAEKKPCHGRNIGMTVHDHCDTQRKTFHCNNRLFIDTDVVNKGLQRMGLTSCDEVDVVSRIGGAAVRASDFRSSGRGFDSRPWRKQVTYRSTQPSIRPR